MASNKALKFYKSSVAPSAAAIGSVWFDTVNRLINVRVAESGENQWQSYSGLQDAKWVEASKTLNLTKADGTILSVNLSDVASAAALTTLTGRVSTAEQAIVDNKATADQGIAQAKADAAVVSTALGEYKTANDARVKAAEDVHSTYKTANDARVLAVENRVSTLETTAGEHGEAIEALQAAIGEGGNVASQINTKIATLDATVGSQTIAEGKHVAVEVVEVDGVLTGLTVTENFADITKSVSDEVTRATEAEAAINKKIGGSYSNTATVAADIQAAKDAAKKAQDDIDAFMKGEAIEGSTIDTLKEIQNWIASDETGTAGLINRVSTNETNIIALQGKVDVEKVSTAIATAKGEAISAAEDYADGLIESEVERAEAAYEKIGVAAGLVKELADGAVAANSAALATVDSRIATAKAGAEETASADATKKANQALANAKTFVGEEIGKLDATVANEGSYITGNVVEVDGVITGVGLSVTTGAVASGADGVALASDVKTYVDTQLTSSWMWETFEEENQ